MGIEFILFFQENIFLATVKFIKFNSWVNHYFYGKEPWNLGVPCLEESKNKMRAKLKGVSRDLESINKQLATNKLKYPNGENYKGCKGRIVPRMIVEKIRNSNKGQKRSEEFCKF
jgi:hypothetical protein